MFSSDRFAGANFLKVGRKEEAEKIFRELNKRNPENHSYYHQLEVALGAETVEQKLAMYAEFREKFPKAQTPERLPLNIASGNYKQPIITC